VKSFLFQISRHFVPSGSETWWFILSTFPPNYTPLNLRWLPKVKIHLKAAQLNRIGESRQNLDIIFFPVLKQSFIHPQFAMISFFKTWRLILPLLLFSSLQEKVKQLVAVDMQELKPKPKLNLSQTQTFCLHCFVSPLWSHRVVPLNYLNTMTLVSIEAWVENAACQLVAVAWLFLVVLLPIFAPFLSFFSSLYNFVVSTALMSLE
jgi:hypothetical protein